MTPTQDPSAQYHDPKKIKEPFLIRNNRTTSTSENAPTIYVSDINYISKMHRSPRVIRKIDQAQKNPSRFTVHCRFKVCLDACSRSRFNTALKFTAELWGTSDCNRTVSALPIEAPTFSFTVVFYVSYLKTGNPHPLMSLSIDNKDLQP
jgi:hypothetical protein